MMEELTFAESSRNWKATGKGRANMPELLAEEVCAIDVAKMEGNATYCDSPATEAKTATFFRPGEFQGGKASFIKKSEAGILAAYSDLIQA